MNRQLVHLEGNAQGSLVEWFAALAARMARVRVASGDWSRVCGKSVTWKHGITGVFLDPPYEDYAHMYESGAPSVSRDVREWAIENGKRADMRIALCGYEGEHEMPGWAVHKWKAKGGYGSMASDGENQNAHRERVWFSPACLGATVAPQTEMFA